MEFIPFFQRQSATAGRETRSVTLFENNELNIHPGTYALVESFCIDDTCDCRKTMIAFVDIASNRVAATIGYGWESAAFYTKWLHGDSEMGAEMAGSYVESGATQSVYSTQWLAWWKDMIVSDEKYRERIRRHHRLFKNQEAGVPRPQVAAEEYGSYPRKMKIGRNEQCPRGSGKKYKKCHGHG